MGALIPPAGPGNSKGEILGALKILRITPLKRGPKLTLLVPFRVMNFSERKNDGNLYEKNQRQRWAVLHAFNRVTY